MYPKEVIDEIIYDFIKNTGNIGRLKYLDLFRHGKQMFESGLIEYKLSEDFWRKPERQGRKAVDTANEVYEYTPSDSKSTEEDKVVNTVDAVNKLSDGSLSSKEKLIGALSMNEEKLKRAITDREKLKEKIYKQENVNVNLKKEVEQLRIRLNEYEELFFQWLDASSNDKVPLINVIKTGKSRTKVVEKLFETMFAENPLQGYEEFESYKSKSQNSNTMQDKVIKFESRNTLVDDLEL